MEESDGENGDNTMVEYGEDKVFHDNKNGEKNTNENESGHESEDDEEIECLEQHEDEHDQIVCLVEEISNAHSDVEALTDVKTCTKERYLNPGKKSPNLNYNCDKCGKGFKFMTNLKDHMHSKLGCNNTNKENKRNKSTKGVSCGKVHI